MKNIEGTTPRKRKKMTRAVTSLVDDSVGCGTPCRIAMSAITNTDMMRPNTKKGRVFHILGYVINNPSVRYLSQDFLSSNSRRVNALQYPGLHLAARTKPSALPNKTAIAAITIPRVKVEIVLLSQVQDARVKRC
jgi:hypothetical protein